MMIPKSPKDKQNFISYSYFMPSARSGWQVILDHLYTENESCKILLPAYIGETDKEGSGIFDPIRATKVKYDFYKVDYDLNVDWEDFVSKLNASAYQLVLIIHYFGFYFLQTDKMIDLCKSKGIKTVEDCAHLYNFNHNFSIAGKKGDFCFYSIHKNLPVSTGGILQANNENGIEVEEDPGTNCEYMETVSKCELTQIITKRRSNYELLYSKFKNLKGIRLLRKLTNNDIPHDFPVIVENGLREKLYFYLIEQGIPVIALYYRMVDELDKEVYPDSFTVADSILNFPIHQDIRNEHVEYIAKQVKEFFKAA